MSRAEVNLFISTEWVRIPGIPLYKPGSVGGLAAPVGPLVRLWEIVGSGLWRHLIPLGDFIDSRAMSGHAKSAY